MTQENLQNPIRVAVIGYGHLGKWHCEKVGLLPQARLTHIVELDTSKWPEIAAKFPQAQVTGDLASIIQHIDAAIIVTPTQTHFELISYLAQKNVHIFCEKPLCSTWQEAQEIQRICQQKKIAFQVGHSERFHQVWERLDDFHELLVGERGTAGKMLSTDLVRISRMAPFKGRAIDVDVVQDLMIHDIDLLWYIFKERPMQVEAFGHKIRTSKWDFVYADFRFPSGRRAIVTSHRDYIRELRTFEISNSRGLLYIDLTQNEIIYSRPHMAGQGIEKTNYQKRDHLLLEQQHFFQSIRTGSPTVVSLQDGMWAVKIVGDVLQGLETGKLVQIAE